MLLSRLSGALSVRMRLIVLSVIPVIGFVAVGVAYVSSEHTVDAAFASVQQSSRLADASRAFKDALTTMQVRAKEFVAQPQPVLVTRFGEAHAARDREPEDHPGTGRRVGAAEPHAARRPRRQSAKDLRRPCRRPGRTRPDRVRRHAGQAARRRQPDGADRQRGHVVAVRRGPEEDPGPADADAPLRGGIPPDPRGFGRVAVQATNGKNSRRASPPSSPRR